MARRAPGLRRGVRCGAVLTLLAALALARPAAATNEADAALGAIRAIERARAGLVAAQRYMESRPDLFPARRLRRERMLLARKHPASAVRSAARDGEQPVRVIEAIADGVVFTSFEHAAEANSLAVLRPRLPRWEKAAAIVRAFGYAGRPYDFDFDFVTDAALVCTELVYKAYQPTAPTRGLSLPLHSMLGRLALPANELARLYDREADERDPQLQWVLFLDGDERSGRVAVASEATFRESWRRPKWHVLAPPPADAD